MRPECLTASGSADSAINAPIAVMPAAAPAELLTNPRLVLPLMVDPHVCVFIEPVRSLTVSFATRRRVDHFSPYAGTWLLRARLRRSDSVARRTPASKRRYRGTV